MDTSLKVPVTALKFSGKALIAGEGPFVKLFDVQKGDLQCRQLVLPGRRIRGFSLASTDHAGNRLLALFGQNDMRIAELADNGKHLHVIGEVVQFPDWILDAQWLHDSSESIAASDHSCETISAPAFIAVATAHNQVTLWNWEDQRAAVLIKCEVHCILYSFRFHGFQSESLWAAAGTVFHDILLWPVSATEIKAKTAARLQGHEGVIFSIQFSSSGDMLCSASDDRSIRLWNIASILRDRKSTETVQLSVPMSILYGHTARVWDARFIANHIISVGEDATCRVWDPALDRNCIHTFTGHKGRSIWSLAVNETDQIIATGGGDTSIRLWSLKDSIQTQEHVSISCTIPANDSVAECSGDFPRLVKLLDVNTAIVFSNTGNIYMCKVLCCASDDSNSQRWTCISQDHAYSSYSVVALSPHHDKLAIGNLSGKIKTIGIGSGDEVREWQAYNGKVFNLIWNKDETLFSTGPDGDLICWNVASSSRVHFPEALFKCVLPPCKHRWVTSLAVVETGVSPSGSIALVCGDRSGSVHYYCMSMDKSHHHTPIQSFHGLHGKHGVSHICTHRGLVYSAGRNGAFMQYGFCDGQLIVIEERRAIKGMEWIEQLFFTDRPEGLLVSGFHSTDFVLSSWKTGEVILKCYCGGAHRAWDFHIDDVLSIATFSYLKGKQLHIVQKQLQKITRPLLQESFHGREAVGMSIVWEDKDSGHVVIATGSEDCDIMLWSFDPRLGSSHMQLQHRLTCSGHVSSVRALSAVASDQEGSLVLFSGGGRASLKCWHVEFCSSQEVSVEASVCHEQLRDRISAHSIAELNSSLRLQRIHAKRTNESESRVMALTSFHAHCLEYGKRLGDGYIVVSGWSDGYIRFYHFSVERKKFMHLLEFTFHSHCVLSITHLVLCPREDGCDCMVVALTAATDGQIALWDCQDLLSNGASHTDSAHGDKPAGSHRDPMSIYKAHQSGVNDVAICKHSGLGGWLLVSGGDDNSLYGALLQTSAKSRKVDLFPVAIGSNVHAHSSSITGVGIDTTGHVVSVSVDQTIRRWCLSVAECSSSSSSTEKSVAWKLIQSCFTNVADVSALILLPKGYIGVCGVGIEIIKFQREDSGEQTTGPGLRSTPS